MNFFYGGDKSICWGQDIKKAPVRGLRFGDVYDCYYSKMELIFSKSVSASLPSSGLPMMGTLSKVDR